ncbi:MAG: DUF3857 and transglutaminase domain-containing protein [Terracidiphilus sp.]|jgi:hypothetical protein
MISQSHIPACTLSASATNRIARPRFWLRGALPLLALAFPALVHAQFRQPTPEELSMTADPKAPGAAAVYLNVEEIANDPLHYQSFYARIKVLTEKGKELATVDVPYLHGDSKITEIKGRTIHADGTVIPLAGKPQDLLISKTMPEQGDRRQVNQKVFTLPSVEVGSILEYTYQLEYDDNHYSSPHWEIQRPYFVHQAHYAFTPFKAFMPGVQNLTSSYLLDAHERVINSLIWWPNLPPGVTVKTDAAGHYAVDVTDIPPAPDEEWMPPVQSILYKVYFYYKAASSADDFWITDAKLWSKDVDRFAEPSKAIKGVVAGLIAPGDSELDRAKKLYNAVQALDNTDYSRKKSESELKQLKLKAAVRAEDIWKQKSGSREDIALLYLAMLRAAGLTAYAFKVVDRDQGVFDTSYLTLGQLDDTLVILATGDKEIVLDPGEKMCPFETVSWRHSSARGLRQLADQRGFETSGSQAYTDNKTLRTGDVTFDSQGALTAVFHFDMIGQEALYWRQAALRNDLDEVKKQFDHSLESIFPEGVQAHVDGFTGLDDPNVNLIANVKAQGNFGSATAKRLMLPAFFLETHATPPFVNQEKRTQPVDMHYSETVTDQVTYHLPAGFTVEGAPRNARISLPGHAILTISSTPAPGQIAINRSLARAFTILKPAEYQDLRAFYQKMAASDQQQLVLIASPATASPAPKGN